MTKKSKSIIKKQQSYLDVIKTITGIITNFKFSRNAAEKLAKRHSAAFNTIFLRLISYLYNYPAIIKWINHYLNDKFELSKLTSSKDKQLESFINLIHTFWYILRRFNLKRSELFYLSSRNQREVDREPVINLLQQYFTLTTTRYFNHMELQFYYKLYQLGVITVYDLESIHQYIQQSPSAKKLNLTQQFIFVETQSQIEPQQSNESTIRFNKYNNETAVIKLINDQLENIISQRTECRQCPLWGKPRVYIDTNINTFDEPIDIIFIGLNPGTEEAKQGKPFVGPSGKRLRAKIQHLLNIKPNFKFVITNVILCSTANSAEIGDIEKVASLCKPLFHEIIRKFNTKFYVPLGADATNVMGINTQSITKISGQICENNIIPILHPSALRSKKMEEIWEKSWAVIFEQFNTIKPNTKAKSQKHFEIKTIEKPTEDLTLLDVRTLDDKQILKIYINQAGEKVYQIIPLQFPVKINQSSDFRELAIVCNQFTDTVILNSKWQKQKLLQICRNSQGQ